jgi:ketosteroid isomerase-like protein
MAQTASPEVLERFKTSFEWWNRGELDLMQDHFAEDAELDVSAVFTDMRPFRGHGSMRRYWEEMWKTWEGMRMDPLEVLDVGGGRVVVDLRMWGKGKRSEAEIDQRFAALYTLHGRRQGRPMPALSHRRGRDGFRGGLGTGCEIRARRRGDPRDDATRPGRAARRRGPLGRRAQSQPARPTSPAGPPHAGRSR